MEIVRIDGMNRDLAPPGGWDAEKHGECDPLPVFAEVVNGDMVMTSAWKPSAEELAHLNAGGAVACVVYGTLHPPIALGVFPAAVCGGQVPLTGEDGVHPGPMPTQELVVKLDASEVQPAIDQAVAEYAPQLEAWGFVEKAFDGCSTGRSERILEDLGLPTEDAHMPLDYIIRQHLGTLTREEREGPSDGEATAD